MTANNRQTFAIKLVFAYQNGCLHPLQGMFLGQPSRSHQMHRRTVIVPSRRCGLRARNTRFEPPRTARYAQNIIFFLDVFFATFSSRNAAQRGNYFILFFFCNCFIIRICSSFPFAEEFEREVSYSNNILYFTLHLLTLINSGVLHWNLPNKFSKYRCM